MGKGFTVAYMSGGLLGIISAFGIAELEDYSAKLKLITLAGTATALTYSYFAIKSNSEEEEVREDKINYDTLEKKFNSRKL